MSELVFDQLGYLDAVASFQVCGHSAFFPGFEYPKGAAGLTPPHPKDGWKTLQHRGL